MLRKEDFAVIEALNKNTVMARSDMPNKIASSCRSSPFRLRITNCRMVAVSRMISINGIGSLARLLNVYHSRECKRVNTVRPGIIENKTVTTIPKGEAGR